MVSHSGLVGFQVLCSLVDFAAYSAAVLSFDVLDVVLTGVQPRLRPEFSHSLVAAVSFQQMLSFPFRFLMSSPLHEQPSIVNVSECANHLFYLKDFLCGVVVVYAVTSVDLHVLVCLS